MKKVLLGLLKLVASIYPAVILSTVGLAVANGGYMFTFEYVFTGTMFVSALAGLYFVWRNKKAKVNTEFTWGKDDGKESLWLSDEKPVVKEETVPVVKKSVRKKVKAKKQRVKK